MSVRTEYLTERLQRYLSRRAAPASIKDKPKAQADELTALVAVLERNAPKSGYDDWWSRLETQIGQDCKHRAWPSEGEVYAAVRAIAPRAGVKVAEGNETDPVAIVAKRMERGEPVGDGYLYGRQALALLRRGLVDHDTMRRYRSALYFSAKNVYGEATARQMEADWIARHEAAEQFDDTARRLRNATVPEPKRPVGYERDGAA